MTRFFFRGSITRPGRSNFVCVRVAQSVRDPPHARCVLLSEEICIYTQEPFSQSRVCIQGKTFYPAARSRALNVTDVLHAPL